MSYWTVAECLQFSAILEGLQEGQHHTKLKNLINTLWAKNPMGCKEVQKKELYWTDKNGCVNCFKDKSYLICNTSYCKLWPPPSLLVQHKKSTLRRRLCHIVNHDGLLLGTHQITISGFPLSWTQAIGLYWKMTHWINTYVLSSREESITVHGTWVIMGGNRYPEKKIHSCGKPVIIFLCGSTWTQKETGPALELHKLWQRAVIL